MTYKNLKEWETHIPHIKFAYIRVVHLLLPTHLLRLFMGLIL